MSHIVVITHEYDHFARMWPLMPRRSGYMLFDVLLELERRDHSFVVQKGLEKKLDGDIAVLHVDTTIVPVPYLAYARTFPRCLNIAATDISKHRVSGAILDGGGWHGPVIVKSILNHAGVPEQRHNRLARRSGRPLPYPEAERPFDYRIYRTVSEVPDDVMSDPNLIIERFIPEEEADGYAMRFWVFCGNGERCTRYVSPKAMVKAQDTTRRESVPVPDELREKRLELGFDYGKFDFVVHEGKAILLDANRTPGRPTNLMKMFKAGAPHLADGLEEFLVR